MPELPAFVEWPLRLDSRQFQHDPGRLHSVQVAPSTSNIRCDKKAPDHVVQGDDMHFSRGFSPAMWMAIGLGIASAWSQTVQAPDRAFDVASIKREARRAGIFDSSV